MIRDKQKSRDRKEARRAIQFPRTEAEAVPEATATVAPPTDLQGLSYRALQAKAKELGLSANGSKEDLLGRLQ